jgi:hypothetical protein
MITKQQLHTVYEELERLEKDWEFDRRRKVYTPQPVSHKLLGLLLQAWKGSNLPQVIHTQPMQKLQDIEHITHKAVRDPKTGQFRKQK